VTNICCFTSVNLAYLSRARTLASTFKQHHPYIDFVLVLSDVFPRDYSIRVEQEAFDRILFSHELGIHDFWRWSFKHNVVELCTAVKPAAAINLLNCGYDKVIYLDPDIAVFSSLSNIIDLLDSNSALLTPHQLSVLPDDPKQIADIELCTLKHGLYNLGFFAVRNDHVALSFLRWWDSRVSRYCYEDVPAGIFTDQKWCDFAPVYFPEIYVIRDYGCNVASWNLHERLITIENEGPLVNGREKLKFYHFTKYGGVGQIMTQRYAQTPETLEIWFWYGRMLKSNSFNLPPKGYYYYGFYQDGPPIPQEERNLFRDQPDLFAENPYATQRPS
jgi:hypothetical protein